MEKMSRTKKYADLRKKIQHDSETEIKSRELSEYANKLNKIDNDKFKAMDVKENPSYNKAHNRKVLIDTSKIAKISEIDEVKYREEDINYNTNEVELIKENYENEIVNKYIDEVKEYNMEKGILSDTDTQLNIINKIRKKPNKNIIRPFGDIDLDEGVDLSVSAEFHKITEELETETTEETEPFYNEDFLETLKDSETNSIAQELDEVLNEIRENQLKQKLSVELQENETEIINKTTNDDSEVEEIIETENQNTEELNIEKLKTEEIEIAEDVSEETVDVEPEENEAELISETIVINDDDEIDTTEENTNNDGLINFIIIVLIVLLLIVIGVFIYFVLMNRGII